MQTRPEGYTKQKLVRFDWECKVERVGHTVRVPHFAEEFHGRRRKGVILGESELGGEDAAFEGGAFGSLY